MAPSHSKDRDGILRTLRRVGPSTITELMRAARPERGARRQYRQLLRTLVRDGAVVLDKKGRLSAQEPDSRGEGQRGARRLARFEGHQDGFGFVNPTDGTRDVFIPPHRKGEAMHGDLVEYEVLATRSGGRREGAITRVAKPTGQRIVGLVTRAAPLLEVVPFDARAGSRFVIEGHLPPEIAEGVAVEIELSRSASGRTSAARLLDVLGPISRPGVDIEVLIRKHDLRVEFPRQVLEELVEIPQEVPRAELRHREDFSRTTVVTIDGDAAKDFDDAVCISYSSRDGFELAVHIADVAHYVQPGSATDIEARVRGTSVYFPGRAVPMLPPALSESLCSLKPGVARLVQSVLMTFTPNGSLQRVRFVDGWIESRARLTYGRVNALLKGAPPEGVEAELLPALRRMSDLAGLLAAHRASRGGIDFDLPEPEVVLDALGAAAGVRPASRGAAQRLIEEFMIAANMAVARHLVERKVAALHRVHERPDPMKVAEFARVAAAFGYDFTHDYEDVEPSDFRNMLDRIAGRPEERSLGRLLLRTMALARYTPAPLGHFGLAAPHYLHFTSPIRRYPDLVAHRALRLARAVEAGAVGGIKASASSGKKRRAGTVSRSARHASERRRKGPDRAKTDEESRIAVDNLDVLAADCSRLERTAEAAERESLAWKRAEVLQGRLGDEMEGTISWVSAQGVSVELDEVYAEGFVPLHALPKDRYRFDPARLVLRGEATSRAYRTGQPLRVLVARVDRIAQRVELALPGGAGGGVSAAEGTVSKYKRSKGSKRTPRRSA